MGAFDVLEDPTIIQPVFNEEEERLIAAIAKLKKYDSEIVKHLEDLANLAERNIMLFNIGLNFLKKR